MKTTKLFFMAALALMMTASCSNDDNDILTPAQPQKAEGIPFTATITVDKSATTRALNELSDGSITASWADNEQVALIYTVESTAYKTDATVTPQGDGTATISATLQEGATNGSAVTIIYPATAAYGTTGNVKVDLLAAQNGTLTGTGGTSIAEKYDVRKGTGKLSISGGTATVNNGTPGTPVSLTNQNSIFKFTLKDIAGTSNKAATQFIISNASGDVLTTVTPASATNELYVALPALAVGTYWFNATVGGAPYIAKATVGTATSAGNYYQTQVNMATLGDLMCSDGKFYANGTAAAAASTTPVGVIAYLGSDAFTENGTDVGGTPFVGHGLLLCLRNAASNVKWSTEYESKFSGQEVTGVAGLIRTTNVSGYTNTATLTADVVTAEKYPAAKAAKNYPPDALPVGIPTLTAPAGTTGWFLPSAQQWVRMMTGLGGLSEGDITWLDWFNNDHSAADKWEAALAKAGTEGTAYESMTDDWLWYWSSSEYSNILAVRLNVDARDTGAAYGFAWGNANKVYPPDAPDDPDYRVRPVLAF